MRCLVLVCLLLAWIGSAAAQEVQLQAFPCDTEQPADPKSPALSHELLLLGTPPDSASKGDLLKHVLGQIRDKPGELQAYGVQITNGTDQPIPINYDTVKMCIWRYAEGAGGRWAAKLIKRLSASPVTEWAGAKSLFANGDTLAPGQTVGGVVYYELSDADKAMPGEPRYSVQYVPPKGLEVKVAHEELVPELLPKLGLEWRLDVIDAPPPRPGKPRVMPETGNTNDKTPLMVGVPGPVKEADVRGVEAHKNIIGEQTQQAQGGAGGAGGGMGMPGGMGGGGGMPGMPGGGGGGGGMPGMPGAGGGGGGMGMPGMPGAGAGGGGGMGMPGMPGMPGAGAGGGGGMPGMPGMPGAGGGGGGMRPRKPATEG